MGHTENARVQIQKMFVSLRFCVRLVIVIGLGGAVCGGVHAAPHVKVGVIRWDCYVGDKHSVGLECERILSGIPLTNQTAAAITNFHFRVPWFGKILPDNKVEARNTDILTVEREIRYAKAAGIDYWATVWYGDQNDKGLSLQRNLWTQSLQRNAVQWCHAFDGNFRGAVGDWTTPKQKQLIRDMVALDFKSDMYLKTDSGRPVVYIIWADPSYTHCVNALYAECAEQGVPEPFVVMMSYETNRERIQNVLETCRASAISSYAQCDGKDDLPFAQNATNERNRWALWKTFDTLAIPSVTMGWDNRIRYYTGCSWYEDINTLKNAWIQYPTADEIEAHTRDALQFVLANESASDFKSILIYAWNENDEGGFIAPTLFELQDPANKGRPVKLDAINRAIYPFRVSYTDLDRHPAAPEIRQLASSSVFIGLPADTFGPDEIVTVREYTAWLVRTFGLYADVSKVPLKANDPFARDLAIAKALDISIRPRFYLSRTPFTRDRETALLLSAITSSEVVTLTAKVLKLLKMSETDADVQRIFNAIPERRMTRAKAAVMLARCLELPFNPNKEPSK